jgi:hypothetical protein
MLDRGLLGKRSYEIKPNHIFIICFVIVVANIAGAALVSKSTDELPSKIAELQPTRWDYAIMYHHWSSHNITVRLYGSEGALPHNFWHPITGDFSGWDDQQLYQYDVSIRSLDEIFEVLGTEGFELVSVSDTRLSDNRTEEERKKTWDFLPYGIQYIFKRPNRTQSTSHKRSPWSKTIQQHLKNI